MLLENNKSQLNQRVSIPKEINKKLLRRLSPLRYPGGKSKLVPLIYSKLQRHKSSCLISPYAGGASVELSLLYAGVVDRLVLNDLDVGIYSMFWVIKHMPEDLIFKIHNFKPTHEAFFQAQDMIKSDYVNCTIVDIAWYTLMVNRLAYSGIYYANPLGGKNGNIKKLTARWNPKNLSERIRMIHSVSDKIEVTNLDAYELIEESYWNLEATILVDPPYVEKGNQLYRWSYSEDDHIELCLLLDYLHQGMPGADIILIYDDHPLIRKSYVYPTSIELINRKYSI